MASIEEKLNDFFNGSYFLVLSWIALVVSAVVASASGEVFHSSYGQGIFFSVSDMLGNSPVASITINIALVTAIGALMQMLNKVFSFVRSVTTLLASSFFLLTMANPLTSSVLHAGPALALIVAVGAFYLFSSYMNQHAQRSIFLTFAIVTTCTMFQWAFVLLLPAFMLGFINMRIMNAKGIIAALLGIFTPFWIVLGLGIASISDFKPFVINSAWETLDISQVRMLVVSIAVTAVAAIALTVVNLVTIINYRRQLRVYNAFFMVVGILTIIAMCIDYRDMHIYLPMLNLSLAVQLAHAFTVNTSGKRYIFVAVLLLWTLCSFVGILFI